MKMLKLCDSMSQNANSQGRFHNPKVGSSIPPPLPTFFLHFNNLEASADFQQSSESHFLSYTFSIFSVPVKRNLQTT